MAHLVLAMMQPRGLAHAQKEKQRDFDWR